MVSTRTQTGTISTKRYNILTLTLLASSPPTSPTTYPRGHRSPLKPPSATTAKPRSSIWRTKTKPHHRHKHEHEGHTVKTKTRPPPEPKPKLEPKSEVKPEPERFSSPLGFHPRDAAFATQMQLPALPASMRDICDGINFFPSRAWGEREEVGLSAIQRAEREVEIWEEVKRAHAEGGLEEMVPGIEMAVEGARGKVRDLREEERRGRKDLGRAGVLDPGAKAIEERLKTLRWALETSSFDPEKENISGAIQAYESGAIQYCDHFTILYAGKVVDTAPNYGAFVVDREERLDRYCEAHGPHWIWYEPPLNVPPESKPKMFGSMALHRTPTFTNLGSWYVTQGFWKRSGWVMRMKASRPAQPTRMEANFARSADGSVYCQEAGPKQAFRSILDSGATYPSLHSEDFNKLMIDGHNYAAQSVETMNTANGPVNSRLFEMFVCVLDDEQKQLVDENHCAHPYHAKYLGGLCPVAEAQGSCKYDEAGREVLCRLSGLLPFVACYIAAAPTRDMMWFGEDRKDVLGSHRMPGGRKWDIHLPIGPTQNFEGVGQKYGDPKTTFTHRDGKIVDEDDANMDFASTVTIMKGTPQEYKIRNCPKEDIEAMREMAKRKEEQAAMEEYRRSQAQPSPFREHSEDPTLALTPEGSEDVPMAE